MLGGVLRLSIQPQGRFKRGKRKFINPERTGQRMLCDSVHIRPLANDDSRLWTSEQLISTSGDYIAARFHRLPQRGGWSRANLGRIQNRPAAQIVHYRNSTGVSHSGKIGGRNLLGESDNAEVARMAPKQKPRVIRD